MTQNNTSLSETKHIVRVIADTPESIELKESLNWYRGKVAGLESAVFLLGADRNVAFEARLIDSRKKVAELEAIQKREHTDFLGAKNPF